MHGKQCPACLVCQGRDCKLFEAQDQDTVVILQQMYARARLQMGKMLLKLIHDSPIWPEFPNTKSSYSISQFNGDVAVPNSREE